MRVKSLVGLLAVLMLLVGVLTAAIVVAKPVEPHPGGAWSDQAVWGIKLTWENSPYSGSAWPGVGTYYPQEFPGGAAYFQPVFENAGTDYVLLVLPSVTEPSSYTWHVRFRSLSRPTAGTLKWELENATHVFLPQDFSVVLENASLGILINCRLVDNYFFTKDNMVDLYIDNAVNIQNIENLDPLSGKPSDPLRLRVTIKNTGRYTDNYRVWCDGGALDPENWTGLLSPDTQTSVTLTTTLPLGTENIVVTAEGDYAKDQDYFTATGLLVRRVEVNIMPEENTGDNGETVTFNVWVKNTGAFPDNYKLRVDNVWSAWLSENQVKDLGPGENEHRTLFVKIPDNARPGDSDTITVTATSEDNENVSDNATCIARVGFYGVEVSILENYKENAPGGKLNYPVRVSNTGTIDDSYRLTFRDNINGDTYWEENISLDNSLLVVPAGENRTTTLKVTIPDNATPGTNDNITVTATSQADNTVENSASCIARVAIVRGVDVWIENNDQTGVPCTWLEYIVHVVNTGNVADTYDLSVGDEWGWDNIQLVDNTLWVDSKNENTTTLRVHIPQCTEGGTEDRIDVTAASQFDSMVIDSDTCTAHVAVVRGVEVEVTPKIGENVRRENVAFTVRVVNTGNVADSFDLSWSDTKNWGGNISLLENILQIPMCGENTTVLRVHIPENAVPGTEDNITVTATSRAVGTIKDNDGCTVRVAFIRGVRVSISPSENGAFPGENVAFTVTVTNTSDNADNFVLYASDNLHWGLSLADNLMENISPGGSRMTRLTVSIPENAAPSTRDNIIVTATSRENENITDNATCIARAIAITRGVGVSISPAEREGMPSDRLSYTVKVTNTGNIADNYDLNVSDNAGWGPSLSNDALDVPAGENRTVTLSVTVPANATPDTRDRIIVTATSRENENITASAICVGRALTLMRIEVMISPGYRNGSPGDALYFNVKVTNTGRVADSYILTTSASGSWLSNIQPSTLTLDPDEFDNATLSVLIPTDAREGDTGIIEVRAVSTTDPMVQGADTCRAIVWTPKAEGELAIPWIQIIIIAAIIAGAVFAAGYLTRRRGRGRRHIVMRRGKRHIVMRRGRRHGVLRR